MISRQFKLSYEIELKALSQFLVSQTKGKDTMIQNKCSTVYMHLIKND